MPPFEKQYDVDTETVSEYYMRHTGQGQPCRHSLGGTTMLKVTEMQIDPRSLGSKFWLTDVIPAYQYTNGQRTDTITGYRYSICLPEKGLEKINIRIEGNQLVEALESGYVEVTLSGIEVFLYWQNGAVQVGAKATGISLVNHKG